MTIAAATIAQIPGTAVVVDDLTADETVLAGGCPCCTVRGELQHVLRRLLAARERGKTHFSRVAIETRNDPAPILRSFATERALGGEFYVEDEFPIDGADCFTLVDDGPLSWDGFSRFIATLTALRGADLLRTKGLLNIEGCRGPVVVQYMQHLALQPVELQAWPDDNRRSRLALTTRNVTEKSVRELFDAVRGLA